MVATGGTGLSQGPAPSLCPWGAPAPPAPRAERGWRGHGAGGGEVIDVCGGTEPALAWSGSDRKLQSWVL